MLQSEWLPQWMKALIKSEMKWHWGLHTCFILFLLQEKKFIPPCWLKQIEEKSEYKRGNKWVNYYSRRVARPLEKMKKLFGDCCCCCCFAVGNRPFLVKLHSEGAECILCFPGVVRKLKNPEMSPRRLGKKDKDGRSH